MDVSILEKAWVRVEEKLSTMRFECLKEADGALRKLL